MGGLEGLINIPDSEGGFGSLEMQLLPDQAANLMNLTSQSSRLAQLLKLYATGTLKTLLRMCLVPVSSLHHNIDALRALGLLGYFADSVTDLRELKAFVRTFGSYGVDRLDRMLKEHTAALLNCIDTTLRANRENLEAVAGSMHSGDRMETEANTKQIVDMDTMVRFCIQAGQAIAFDYLLSEASGVVLEEGAPLIYSLLAGVAKHLPGELPEKKEIRRMGRVANTVNVVNDRDFE